MLSFAEAPQLSAPFSASRQFGYANAAADWAFYDVSALSAPEFNFLINEQTVEGSVLIALPSGEREMGIIKYSDFKSMKAGKGRPLQRFSIAGVGSSDLGAAAFARSLADHYQEPVGAIVAGYGVADILQEALGGWFVLGGVNRTFNMMNRWMQNPFIREEVKESEKEDLVGIAEHSPDTETLLHVLLDQGREVKSVVGHSKGSLSIALALQALSKQSHDMAPFEKAKAIEVITFGAVVNFPEDISNLKQYIGDIDWFGALNSRPLNDRITVQGAWHHLNTQLPYHLDLVKVLGAN